MLVKQFISSEEVQVKRTARANYIYFLLYEIQLALPLVDNDSYCKQFTIVFYVYCCECVDVILDEYYVRDR